MKGMRIFSLMLLAGLLGACGGKAQIANLGDNTLPTERRVLVTFVDQTINRTLPGNAQDAYQVSGVYSNSGWSARTAQRLAESYRLEFVAQWPVSELGISCVVYEVPNGLPLDATMDSLKHDKAVTSVQPMQRFDVLAAPPAGKAYSDPYLPLQKSFNEWSISDLHQQATGRGIRIAVIDSGVDIDHPDLKGQIEYLENTAPEPGDHNLADKHGTAVAGVLSAHADNGIGIVGIAPDADVLAFRACWPDQPNALAAHCNSFTLALALNKAIRMQSRIINLSLSGPEDPLLKMLVEKAISNGIVVVAAVPGQNQPGGFPANVPGVIAVSQGEIGTSDAIAAPGLDILTTVPNNAYDFMTGSSFATPHVAGLVALLLELNPNWQADEIKQQLAHPHTWLKQPQS